MVYGSAKVFTGWNPMNVVVQSALDPSSHALAIRAAVRAIDSSVPVYDVRPVTELFDGVPRPAPVQHVSPRVLRRRRAAARLHRAFRRDGVSGLAADARDIGLRLALGAAPRDVLRLVLGQGLALAAAGAAIGVLAGLAGGSLMRTLLYSVTPTDAVTLISVPLGLLSPWRCGLLRPGATGDEGGSADCIAIGVVSGESRSVYETNERRT